MPPLFPPRNSLQTPPPLPSAPSPRRRERSAPSTFSLSPPPPSAIAPRRPGTLRDLYPFRLHTSSHFPHRSHGTAAANGCPAPSTTAVNGCLAGHYLVPERFLISYGSSFTVEEFKVPLNPVPSLVTH
ncbi:uncharacterized protein LOC131004900 [Salvia miltiorrhiza]|uniref:uncharacterized protein LOC131004900 n=1 Tax=Salvia miltiorrhiza TaxID=226208 RepID=UPI0025AD1B5A|nr:uncharacterized protein LOC131004900 [Salvia miltiorrhiza]